MPSGDPIKIKIVAYPVDGKRIAKARLISSYGDTTTIHHFKTDEQTGERYAVVTITSGKGSDYPYPPGASYFRVEVQFAKKGDSWTTYTNPIFVKLFSLPPLEQDFPQGKCWQWTMDGIGWGAAVTLPSTEWAPVQPGDHIRGYIWFNKSIDKGYVSLQFRAFDATGTSLGAFCGTTVYPWATGWVHMEADGYTPANAARVRAEIVVAECPLGVVQMDAFRYINYRSYSYCRHQFEGSGDNPFIIDYPAPRDAQYIDVQYP